MIIVGLCGPTGQQSWQVVTICPRWDPGSDQSEADGILIPNIPVVQNFKVWGGLGSDAQRYYSS